MLQMLSWQALPTVALLFVAAVELEALVFVERPVVVWAAVLEALRLGAKESSALKNLAALALQRAALLVAAGLLPIVRAVLWAAVPVVQLVVALLAIVSRSLVELLFAKALVVLWIAVLMAVAVLPAVAMLVVVALLVAKVVVVQPVAALLAVVSRSLVVQPLAVLAVFSVVAFVAPRSDAHQGR